MLSADENSVNNGLIEFSLDVARAMDSEDWTVSPLSMAQALTIMANGADDATRSEICSLLHIGNNDVNSINSYFGNVLSKLSLPSKNTTFINANAVFFDESMTINDNVANNCNQHLGASFEPLDFKSNIVVSTINKWFAEHTENLINDMLEGEDIANNNLIICNALFYQGKWMDPFEERNTNKQKFYTSYASDANFVEVNMMHDAKRSLAYAETKEYKAARIEYNNRYSFTVMMPNDGKEIEESLSLLTKEKYEEIENQFSGAIGAFSLPKWKAKDTMSMSNVIMSMGYENIFGNSAKYTGFFNSGNAHFNMMKHSTTIEVDENGTKMSAATIVGGDSAPAPSKLEFVVDRPFFSLIKEKSTGAILLMGKVSKIG
ncbi:MAG: serpin family protein [Muribaculaceae bacterium]